jgi:hypothetical protein
MLKIGMDDACPYCGNLEVYRSQPTTWLERVCVLCLLDLARCHGCMRQHYRLLLFPAPEYPVPLPEEINPDPTH